ncbi:unnamed protein product [Ceutorhynchus assimilis]|uniref:aspartate transaminase n=1 Tax=Ceutorhynchus assimilis TaxID=467358 RepID=A0A9N9MQZ3_9CUCU|nr:unnamed protein product [Ceutorhynchus assimilis]
MSDSQTQDICAQDSENAKVKLQSPSWFKDLQLLPPEKIYSLNRQFKADDYEHKLDFAFPCYRDENGKPWVFPVVRQAETVLANDGSLNKKRLEPFGYKTFNSYALTLLLGENSSARVKNQAFTIQTIGLTGTIRTGAEFLVKCLKMTTVYGTEQNVDQVDKTFLEAGFQKYKTLRYFNNYTLSLDERGLLEDLARAPSRSVIFLQVSGHDPTGIDPSHELWEKIANIMKTNELFPFFYSGFQGFATGNLNEDAEPVRLFERQGLEFLCVQTFAWNFGLFNDRCGSLTIVLNDTNQINPVKSHLRDIITRLYSTPPSHGARIVAFILGDRMLSEEWTKTISAIADRLRKMRLYLREELQRLRAPGTWNHLTRQVGMFSYTGLRQIQVQHLKKQHHIYLLDDGRMNVSGLNLDNVQYIAMAINQTLTIIPPML